VPLETTGENVAFGGVFDRRAGCRDPDAASGQFAFDVRYHLARRIEHEADYLRGRLKLAGERAGAFRPRGDAGCPAIEFAVLRSCTHHCYRFILMSEAAWPPRGRGPQAVQAPPP